MTSDFWSGKDILNLTHDFTNIKLRDIKKAVFGRF